MEELLAIVLVDHGDVLLKVLYSDTLNDPLLSLGHMLPNLWSSPSILRCILPIQLSCHVGSIRYLLLEEKETCIRNDSCLQKQYTKAKAVDDYLMKEFKEDIYGKWIPRRSLLHLSLARFVIRNGNEVLEILKLEISKHSNSKQSDGEVVFDTIVLRRPIECINEK